MARVDGRIGDTGAKKYWYVTDHLGSIRAVTDKDGKKVWSADYLAFGKQYTKDGDFEELHSFTGKEYDPDTGLHYYNARWYDADLGRFISEDPVADPNNPNLYSYGANNPLSRIDPTGLFWDGYETDWETEEGYNGYLATEEDMAGAGTYDNSTWESSGESASGSENSKGFWESIYDFFTGRERKSDEEMAEEFLDRHTKELIDDLKNRYKDFEDYWSGGSESIDYALKGVMGSELLATAFGRTFDVSDYIYEDFGASALLAGALAACLVMGFSDPEDHLKALRNGVTAFAVVVGGLRTLPFLMDKNQQLANMIAQKYGGLIKPAAGNGWIIKIENITIRIMNSGGGRNNYWRASVENKGSVDKFGNFCSDRSLTHIDITKNSFKDICNVIDKLLGK